ncbi:hypothetical protein DL769_000511 [Monosporascus sp. CRB-8-3]|nr:hypothetical protein DL769_000511 [Monosporascus sp. CRB-8-3]
MSELVSHLAKLNPLSRRNRKEDEEDVGEEIDDDTVAGGGHSGRQGEIAKSKLRISHALKSFIVKEGILSKEEADPESEVSSQALRQLLRKSHIDVPAQLTDRSHPLPEYFISSSHNTYLLGHQLHGTSSAVSYERALNTGSRCVEIDAWDYSDNIDEPKVTHGYTLVSNIPFRSVCETIRDVVDREATQGPDRRGYGAAPILISLENHCGPHGQMRLVEIMREVFGDRLLSKPVRDRGHAEQEGSGDHVSLEDLGSKIAVIVEYHFPDEDSSSSDDSSDSDSDEEEEERRAHAEYKEKRKAAAASSAGIIPELAELGVYAQSVKPRDNSWFEEVLKDGPHHHLINVSEKGLAAHLPEANDKIARHNARHLMRVYPKGTRISSKNLQPVPFWAVGAQICAMNWQTFGASMQLNEALFHGTDGYVLKPACLRAGGDGSSLGTGRRKRLRLRVAGATDVPVAGEHEEDEIRPYVTCTLIHPDDAGDDPPKRKTEPYRQHRLGFLHRGENPPPTDPVWDETLEWEYDDNDLAFLRILIKSDISFKSNPIFAVAAVRLLYLVPGWSFVRMLDLKGHETNCTLLVKFEVEDV